jgi:hypothetical protein
MRQYLLPIIVLGIVFGAAIAHASSTDRDSRLNQEALKFVSDCSDYAPGSGDQIVCQNSKVQFISEYSEAMYGNVFDQADLGYMFTLKPPYGVTSDADLSCAWYIVTDDNGGIPGQSGQIDSLQASNCRGDDDAVNQAKAIEAEITAISNQTY